MSSKDGGLYRFGVLSGYGFILLIIVSIVIVTIILPGTIIYYVNKVPPTPVECESSAVGAPKTSSAEIGDEEFDGWWTNSVFNKYKKISNLYTLCKLRHTFLVL